MKTETLNALGAVQILFGNEQLLDPDFDPAKTQFRSGADVCESLASHFGFQWEDYDRLAAELRGPAKVEVYVWDRKARPGYLTKVRNKTVSEVYAELREILGEYPDGGEEYFMVSTGLSGDEEWPDGDIVCLSVNGSSEGDYSHVEVHHNGSRTVIFVGKTFMGRDASWAFARRLADLLEIQ